VEGAAGISGSPGSVIDPINLTLLAEGSIDISGAANLTPEAIEEWGMQGFKLMPSAGFKPNDRLCYPLYEKCTEWQVPIVFHSGGLEFNWELSSPNFIATAAEDFPDVPMVMAHAGLESWEQCRLACADSVEDALTHHHDEIAALIVEPMLLAAGGMITMPPGYLTYLRKLCTRYRVLMIADEVATGFGRTGRMFACEHEGVKPDLMAVSKGLTGGYLPLAATLATEKVYRAFLGRYEEFKTFFHGHSYTGNPLGCAVALANLDVFEKEKTLDRLQPKIASFRRLLEPLREHPHVGDIRQIGLMAGIELVKSRATKAPYPLTERVGMRVADEARTLGLLIRPLGNIIVLMPPLSTTLQELRKMVGLATKAIKAVTSDL